MHEFPRKKPFKLWMSITYRLYKFSNSVLGRERVLKLLLNAHFMVERLSWESIFALYKDDAFTNTNLSQLMEKWISPNSRIVDIGCGNGRLSVEASRFGSVVGIDHVDSFRESSEVEFRTGDAMEVDEQFDVAILSHIIEHLDDPETLLRSIKANMILVEVPNFDYDGRNACRVKLDLPFYTDDDHVREYTVDALCEQLDRTGWAVNDKIVNSAISVAATRI